MAVAPDRVLSFEEARHAVEEQAAGVRPRGKELVELLDAAGEVLAEPVMADRDFPPFRRATRDGYALQAAELKQLPATLEVIGEIKAGASPAESAMLVQAGQAASIMTGAPVPQGADAVVMVEYTERDGNRVSVTKAVEAGANVVPVGSEAKRGQKLLEAGMRLDHSAIAVAASVGRAHLLVYSRPRVAVLSTGDELVDVEELPGPNQIRNSNSYSLAVQIKAAGGEPVLLPVARDESLRLRELIADGLECDLLLLTGGVSMGKYDLVEQVLGEFGAEFFFTGAKIQPGKPIVFGRIPADGGSETYFFGLPGNPVSTMVTFELFARPMLESLSGMKPQKLVFAYARLKKEIKTKTGLKRFLPAVISGEFEQAEVELAKWEGSGDIAATARANAYLVIPPDRETMAAGEWVAVIRK